MSWVRFSYAYASALELSPLIGAVGGVSVKCKLEVGPKYLLWPSPLPSRLRFAPQRCSIRLFGGEKSSLGGVLISSGLPDDKTWLSVCPSSDSFVSELLFRACCSACFSSAISDSRLSMYSFEYRLRKSALSYQLCSKLSSLGHLHFSFVSIWNLTWQLQKTASFTCSIHS